MTSRFRTMSYMGSHINSNGRIDSANGLAFNIPISATGDGMAQVFTAGNLPTSGNDNGRMGLVSHSVTYSEEGDIYFWDGSDWTPKINYKEWGAGQNPAGSNTLTSSSSIVTNPNNGGGFFLTNVAVSLTFEKSINEDPVVEAQVQVLSGENVTIANATQTFERTNSKTVNWLITYPAGITANTSTTLRFLLTDPQGQNTTLANNNLVINWIADTAPTVNTPTISPTSAQSQSSSSPVPGDTITITVTGNEPQNQTLQYRLERVSGNSITTSPSLNTWTTDNTFEFTVPSVDDGSNDYNSITFRAKVRDASGNESAYSANITPVYKRAKRTAKWLKIISRSESSRGSATDKYGVQQIAYPANIQSGDILFLWIGAYGVPAASTWDGSYTTYGEYPFAMQGDNLNGSGGSYSAVNPNTYGGAPSIVTSHGWERAYNPGSGSGTSLYTFRSLATAFSYERRYQESGLVKFWNGSSSSNEIGVIDCFFKIASGSESGNIPLFDTHSSSSGYEHVHHGETVQLMHLRMQSAAGSDVAASSFGILFAEPDAWPAQNASAGIKNWDVRIDNMDAYAALNSGAGYSWGTNGASRDIRAVDVTDDPIFYWTCLKSLGDNNNNMLTSSQAALYVSSSENYYNTASLYKLGDAGAGDGNNVTDIRDGHVVSGTRQTYYEDNTQTDYNVNTRVWFGTNQATTALDTSGSGLSAQANQHVAVGSLWGEDARRVTTSPYRDLSVNYSKAASATEKKAIGHAGAVQFKSNDPLYP